MQHLHQNCVRVSTTYQRIDGLLGQIEWSGSIVLALLATSANLVDLLVDLSSVMVTLLTGTSHGELNARWMPSTNTGDLTQTLVSLAGQLLAVPTRGDSLETSSLGHTNHVDHFVLSEHIVNQNGLFKMLASPVNLLSDGATVHLDFHKVCLLLAFLHQTNLGVSEHTNHGTILLDSSQIIVDLTLASWISPLLGGTSESLLLGLVP